MNEKFESVRIDPWDGWKRLSFACQATGLKRSWFYPKIKEGKIRSAVLKDDHRSRGVRLIHMPSLRAYIEGHLIEERPGSSTSDTTRSASAGASRPPAGTEE